MPLKDFALFLLVGRLLIWLTQTNGLLEPVWKRHEKLQELRECDLCLGFWVYLVLAVFNWERPFKQTSRPVEWGILAAVASFTMHLIRLGWGQKFNGVIIDDAI